MFNFYNTLGQTPYFLPNPAQLYMNMQQTPPTQPRKKKVYTRKYSVISDEERTQLLKLVLEDQESIKKASETVGIKLSTCKAIIKTYKTSGRIGKKKERIKKRKMFKKTYVKPIDQLALLKKSLPKLGQNCMYLPPYLIPQMQKDIKQEYSDTIKQEH